MAKEKKEDKKEKKSFVWQSLRISFWTLIGTYIISVIFNKINPNLTSSLNVFLVTIGLIQTIAIFFTFVVSIIHLTKYKEKVFAIIALVISSLSILLFLMGILVGLNNGLAA